MSSPLIDTITDDRVILHHHVATWQEAVAAVANTSHREALRAFVAIAGDRTLQERLAAADSVESFQQILRREACPPPAPCWTRHKGIHR